jgi:hypothetical protein
MLLCLLVSLHQMTVGFLAVFVVPFSPLGLLVCKFGVYVS